MLFGFLYWSWIYKNFGPRTSLNYLKAPGWSLCRLSFTFVWDVVIDYPNTSATIQMAWLKEQFFQSSSIWYKAFEPSNNLLNLTEPFWFCSDSERFGYEWATSTCFFSIRIYEKTWTSHEQLSENLNRYLSTHAQQ